MASVLLSYLMPPCPYVIVQRIKGNYKALNEALHMDALEDYHRLERLVKQLEREEARALSQSAKLSVGNAKQVLEDTLDEMTAEFSQHEDKKRILQIARGMAFNAQNTCKPKFGNGAIFLLNQEDTEELLLQKNDIANELAKLKKGQVVFSAEFEDFVMRLIGEGTRRPLEPQGRIQFSFTRRRNADDASSSRHSRETRSTSHLPRTKWTSALGIAAHRLRFGLLKIGPGARTSIFYPASGNQTDNDSSDSQEEEDGDQNRDSNSQAQDTSATDLDQAQQPQEGQANSPDSHVFYDVCSASDAATSMYSAFSELPDNVNDLHFPIKPIQLKKAQICKSNSEFADMMENEVFPELMEGLLNQLQDDWEVKSVPLVHSARKPGNASKVIKLLSKSFAEFLKLQKQDAKLAAFDLEGPRKQGNRSQEGFRTATREALEMALNDLLDHLVKIVDFRRTMKNLIKVSSGKIKDVCEERGAREYCDIVRDAFIADMQADIQTHVLKQIRDLATTASVKPAKAEQVE
eukprot:TRINITY_DN9287_c2_g1_i1.p1 TRINITY_DN9287_c2_g1~~TRINITY_DN9287_c2_g1_i1.p1  ORF type:complete len:520 (+),score=79.72 TRINITY_DN9287_c2_g1_i1:71-1630(+)